MVNIKEFLATAIQSFIALKSEYERLERENVQLKRAVGNVVNAKPALPAVAPGPALKAALVVEPKPVVETLVTPSAVKPKILTKKVTQNGEAKRN